MKRILFVLLFFLSLTFFAQADSTSEFSKANFLYRDGKYEEAIKTYESILASGVESGPIYYNLANSYFKQKQIGKAVLNYERAHRLIPRDHDLLDNEKFVLSIGERLWPIGSLWQKHIRFYTINEMTIILAIILLAIAGIHLLGLYRNWP